MYPPLDQSENLQIPYERKGSCGKPEKNMNLRIDAACLVGLTIYKKKFINLTE